MKSIHKTLFMIIGVLIVIFIELNENYSIEAVKIIIDTLEHVFLFDQPELAGSSAILQ